MEIVFKDKKLRRIETDDAEKTKLPISVIKSYRKKLLALRSIVNERDLRNLKSLHYEKLKGERNGQRSIRINDQFRLIFELDNQREPARITILEIVDYH